MDQKQMIHVASEVVVLMGLTYYFNQKNKKLMSFIDDLTQRIEDQEDIISKHDEIIERIVAHISNKQAPPVHVKKKQNSKVRTRKQNPEQNKTQYNYNVTQPEENIDSESDSDLDSELAEELKELEKQKEMDQKQAQKEEKDKKDNKEDNKEDQNDEEIEEIVRDDE